MCNLWQISQCLELWVRWHCYNHKSVCGFSADGRISWFSKCRSFCCTGQRVELSWQNGLRVCLSESTIFSFADTKVYLDLWMCTCSWRSSGFVRMSAVSLTFYSFWFVGSCHRYVSEYYMKQYATPRPLFLLLVQVVMAVAHLLFASSGNFWL